MEPEDSIKYSNLCVSKMLEEKGTEKVFGELMAQFFPNLMKDKNLQMQDI